MQFSSASIDLHRVAIFETNIDPQTVAGGPDSMGKIPRFDPRNERRRRAVASVDQHLICSAHGHVGNTASTVRNKCDVVRDGTRL